MGMIILKAIALFGVLFNIILMIRKQKQMKANTERDSATGLTFEETWAKGMEKKNLITTLIVGIVANFFDTLGVGSFAPSSTAFKVTKSVDDALIPGTLNVGDTIPVCIEAFFFFGFVDMDILTLVSLIISSIVGAYTMAGVVSRFDRKRVRYAMFVGLFLLATITLMRWAGVGPFGQIGTAMGLRGIKLIIAIIGNFVLGALMSIGVGLYAPCMAMLVILGLDTGCAFPAMMGSCAFLMAFGNGPKFIQEGRYDPVACWTQGLGGAIGVFLAYYLVKSMSIRTLTLIVIIVCYFTAAMFLRDAIKKGSAA